MSFWDHVANPSKRLSHSEYLVAEQVRVTRLMRLPTDISSATPPPRAVDHLPYVYRTEEIKRVEVQRPLDLDDAFIDAFPFMAAALTHAHRLRLPFEMLF